MDPTGQCERGGQGADSTAEAQKRPPAQRWRWDAPGQTRSAASSAELELEPELREPEEEEEEEEEEESEESEAVPLLHASTGPARGCSRAADTSCELPICMLCG